MTPAETIEEYTDRNIQRMASILDEISSKIDGYRITEHWHLDNGQSAFTVEIAIPLGEKGKKGGQKSTDYILQILYELCNRDKIDRYCMTEHYLLDDGNSLFIGDVAIPKEA